MERRDWAELGRSEGEGMRAEVKLACGRWYLLIDGLTVAMESDPCRSPQLEGNSWDKTNLEMVAQLINSQSGVDSPARANLEEAWRLTHGDRKAAYGDVSVTFARYAKVWSGILGAKLKEDLTANDVTLCMTALKLAREANRQQSDNVTDAHGYLILHDEIKSSPSPDFPRPERACTCGGYEDSLHSKSCAKRIPD